LRCPQINAARIQWVQRTDRCRTVSYKQMPLATDTFKLSTPPAIGMRTS
jgi:hypothetical protein